MVFDPALATRNYVDSLGSAELAKAHAYTLGNHWLVLWGLVISALVTWIIVKSGVLDRVAARFQNRRPVLRNFMVALLFLFLDMLLTLPWAMYSEWLHERQYGLSSQPFGDWLVQTALASSISILSGALLMLGLYAFIRKMRHLWWLWAGVGVSVFLAFAMLLSPTLIDPLFNSYQPVPAGPVRDALVQMADEADIPQDRIFMYDGSRQSNNFTANVSGIGSSARIAISDIALKEASLDEVKAVTAHEIGHYVLGHVWRTILVFSLVSVALFFLTDRLYPLFARWFGEKAPIHDIRGAPVLFFVFGLLFTLATPITNSLSRMGESEADRYSLEMVNLPDALSKALLKTAEYRYPRPEPVEEVLFYTHPSVERRIEQAMEWKASHPQE